MYHHPLLLTFDIIQGMIFKAQQKLKTKGRKDGVEQ